jgi:3-methyladenine DNA glycosylase AlkD
VTAHDVQTALRHASSEEDAVFLQRFFKTGKGQYGEGDIFLGVRVPATRAICKQYRALTLKEVQKLLASPVHEARLAALIILTYRYPKATADEQKTIYDLYLANVRSGRVNNWDLVDLSALHIVGAYLLERPRDLLYNLARSDNVWQKRVAILSTFQFINHGDASTSLALADILLYDPHDLIQKAVGWMLREIGKRVSEAQLTEFLDKHAATMPRMTLRYAVERLTSAQKTHYMQQKMKSLWIKP